MNALQLCDLSRLDGRMRRVLSFTMSRSRTIEGWWNAKPATLSLQPHAHVRATGRMTAAIVSSQSMSSSIARRRPVSSDPASKVAAGWDRASANRNASHVVAAITSLELLSPARHNKGCGEATPQSP
jgi:hypothetical protein